ncbi:hypothetical protein GXP67_00435 [Rhodocytophaga rosea]|uniref:Acyltransferase family protein n=1 Tax=Rhodocytophaga rosea TaxID=2704465 RepID=A0A6C0GBH4_9BACT|nr:hypothetical protein [Rhodocytophaga rosea]QHT65247.1 hypothetical protein GXP67_00435 [Rhodocytophaga rosea]
MSFFNLEKYPPSFLFLCLTLGIALLLLSGLEGRNLVRWQPITLFGKVALFYYILHLFAIHTLALLIVMLLGYPWQTMIFIGPTSQISPILQGKYGFDLVEIYLLWISIVSLLYPVCVSWYLLKNKNKSKWWVSYV